MTVDSVIKNVVDETVKAFGKISILVNLDLCVTMMKNYFRFFIKINSAGIIKFGTIENMNFNDYNEVMNANVTSILKLTQLCVPHLINEKGSIVNVSSVCGTRSFPNILAYAISKAAIDQFTKCTALELAAKGVRVNAIK